MSADSFPGTVPDLLAWRASQEDARRAWLAFEGDTWTLRDVTRLVDAYATSLAERGVVKGDRVAILLGNTPETLFASLAANQLGAIAAPLSPAYKEPELAGVLALTTPRVLVVKDESLTSLSDRAARSLAENARPHIVSPDALARNSEQPANAPRANVKPEDPCVLLATSGTTGAPKAVVQSHRTYTLTAEAFPAWVGIDEKDTVLLTLPLFHINAQVYGTMGALGAGARLALLPKFSASRFWGDAKRYGATQVNAVGAIVNILLDAAPGNNDKDHSLRLIYTALALSEARHRAFEERFGVELTVGYGLSESTLGTIWPRRDSGAPRPYGTMGALRQHPRAGNGVDVNRARVVLDDGTDAGVNEVGELWLDNPCVMLGYLHDDAQTKAVREGPWLKTGDLVTRDASGIFTFISRKKEVIRRRGENVAAREIELALERHPTVREAAVIGVPAKLGEEDIVAYVSARQGMTIDVPELLAWARAQLSDFKVPSEIRVRDALPRTATERVAKHLLR